MIKRIRLNQQPTTLKIVVESRQPIKIWLKVSDIDRKNTYYTKRYGVVDGKQEFFVRMPQTPPVAKVVVFNEEYGLVRGDRTFRVVSIKKVPLKTIPLKMSKQTRAFVKFAQEFSSEAGTLSASDAGDIYRSNNGKFRIDYFPYIESRNTGKKIKTPARISQLNGRIEVSKYKFKSYTIPMRMAILLHEYSHFYLYRVPSDESEADLNGLKIFLSLGYPRIDAYNVFLNVFKKSPSKQNVGRYEALDNFIKEFEKENKSSKYE